jgi:hypothetical protein
MTVPWPRFVTFPDGQPKFSDAWLANPSNVVSCFRGEPSQYCRLCDSYFEGVVAEHVAGHASELAAWRKLQNKKSITEVLPSDFPRNHAGKSGQNSGNSASSDVVVESDGSPEVCPHPLSDEDRRKAHSPASRKRRQRTLKGRSEAKRAEAWKLYESGLVSSAIADQLGISDRTLRRYLDQSLVQTN